MAMAVGAEGKMDDVVASIFGGGAVRRRRRRGAVWRQLLAGFLASLQAMSAGAIIGWDPVGGPVDGPWRRADDSWMPSVASLGVVAGAAPAGWLADLLGRRTVLLAAAVPGVVGWVLVVLADSTATQTPLLYAGRFFSGVSAGAVLVAVCMYNAEVASPRCRGTTGSLLYLMFAGGLVWSRALAAFAPPTSLPLVAAATHAASALALLLAPESPTFLARRGRAEAAEAALARLGVDDPPRAALELRELLADRPAAGRVLRVGVVVVGLMSFQQLVGARAVAALSRLVFPQSWSETLPPTLALAVCLAVGGLLPAAAGDAVGRKVLLTCSAASMTVAHLALSLFLFVRGSHPGQDLADVTWLPVAAAMAHGVAFGAGFGPMPWVVVPEVAPPAARGVFVSVAVCAWSILALVFTRAFYGSPEPVEHPELSLIFCFTCCIAILFVVLFVPETKGRSMKELLGLLK